MSTVASPVWFARHELRFAWRDFQGVVTAGRRHRLIWAGLAAAALGLFLHALAKREALPYAAVQFPPDKETLVVVSGSAFLAWTLMISQALESVTRAFYSRSDLDLLLASPVSARTVFAVRIGTVTAGTAIMSMLLVGPFINVLTWGGGVRWLSAYGVLMAAAMAACALAVAMTVALFRLIGAKRTRLAAQIAAAIVGAAFVIGIQAVSIFSFGNMSRIDGFHSAVIMDNVPGAESLFWLPARAAMGDGAALTMLLAGAAALLVATTALAADRFSELATAAAGVGHDVRRQQRRRRFRGGTPASVLRRKEWTLLLRDPWLMSQSLMQILYLIPPALLLWRRLGGEAGTMLMIPPVLVMAAGQLAGGLAWLAISGEDAPDLTATAPVSRTALLKAKIEAVLIAVAIVLTPILLAVVWASPWTALVSVGGVLAAATSTIVIQLLFRTQAKRSSFRRRQTSSRAATFCEAFASVAWAGAAGLVAAGQWLFVIPVAIAFGVIGVAALLRPRARP